MPSIPIVKMQSSTKSKEQRKNNFNTFDWEVRLRAYSKLKLYTLFLHDA